MRAPARTVHRARRLRRAMSLPEVILWTHLRGSRLAGLRFRRQHPLGAYILDFYSHEARLCVEIDGWAHDTPAQAAHDAHRTRWLEQQGLRVLRLPATDILRDENLEGALLTIIDAANGSHR